MSTDILRSARAHGADALVCSDSVGVIGDPQADLRRQFVAACKVLRVAVERAEAAGLLPGDSGWPSVSFQPFAGLRCGARTKGSGKPCKLLSIFDSGRCKFHGGMSSGPRSPEGKARSALNGHHPKRTPQHRKQTGRSADEC